MLDRFIFIIGNRIDFEHIQRFDEGDKFLESEIADIEVGKLFVEQIAQRTGENPAVIVGIFFRDFYQRLPDCAEIFARSFF